jgi:hypothetical protein
VSHVINSHAPVLVIVLFKRENHRHPIDPSEEFLHSPRSPGPNLRADVVKNRDFATLCGAGKREIEIRIVDQDDEVRTIGLQDGLQFQIGAGDQPNPGEDFRKSDHSHLGRGEKDLDPCILHLLSADTAKLGGGVPFPDGPDEQ